MRTQIDYKKVVNFDSEKNEIKVLDYVFSDDTFKGAVGSTLLVISKEEYKERTSKDNVIDSIIEVGVPEQFVRGGANECYKAMKRCNEIESFCFDTSCSELWPYLREELKLNKTNAFIFECTGGGRCFDKDFEGNVNVELSAIIREYEK